MLACLARSEEEEEANAEGGGTVPGPPSGQVFFDHPNRSPRHLKVSQGSKPPRTPHTRLPSTLRASGLSGWTRAPNRPPAGPWHPPGRKLEAALTMSDFWHKLGCCVVEKAQPQQRKRRRIDRSMIGEPMNFVHLTHIGSGDMVNEGLPAVSGAVQEMRSKCGRERPWSNSHIL